MTTLLKVDNLVTEFSTHEGVVRAVDGLSFEVAEGEILGLVGESGSGKTVTALSLLRLISDPGRVRADGLSFEGRDILSLSRAQMTGLRGDAISMIFQQPRASLDPVQRVGKQIAELFIRHRDMPGKQAAAEAVELLRRVGIPDPEKRAHSYPHELSGGQAQRVMIAMALALKPRLLIADEPTTALDVTIQAQILSLLRNLCRETGTAMILVTHDLGVIAQTADRVAVMYAGQIVEQQDVYGLFDAPQHPYTQALLRSVPVQGRRQDRLTQLPGNVPHPGAMPPACRFAPRCARRVELGLTRCTAEAPPLAPTGTGGLSRCWIAAQSEERS